MRKKKREKEGNEAKLDETGIERDAAEDSNNSFENAPSARQGIEKHRA